MNSRDEVAAVTADVQVVAKPQRRTYPGEYKRRILKETYACSAPAAIGVLLRREGLPWLTFSDVGGAPGSRGHTAVR